MSDLQSAAVAREFFNDLRNNGKLLAAWNELPKDAASICAFVSTTSGVEVRESDLPSMRDAIESLLCGSVDTLANEADQPRAVGFAYAMVDDRQPRAVGFAYAMVDDRQPRAVGFMYAMQNEAPRA